MSRRLPALLLVLGALGAACAALTLRFFRSGGRLNIEPGVVSAFVALGSLWIIAGLFAWWKHPENRTGTLMTVAGFLVFTWLPSGWDASFPSTVFGILDRLFLAVMVHLIVAFPGGRVTSRTELVVVAAAYTDVLLVSGVGAQLFLGPEDPYSLTGPRNLLLVHDDRRLADTLELAGDICLALFFVVAVALLVNRWRTASRPARKAIAPVLWSGVLVLAFGSALLTHWRTTDTSAGTVLLWAFLAAVATVPIAFLVGLLRTRLHRSAVAELVVELGSLPSPAHLRDAIARCLGDPSLELAFWLPNDNRYVDADGAAFDAEKQPGRVVTVLEHNGQRLAALAYDPSLLDEPELVQSVGAAASLALENARLEAELRAQLAEVRASRTRIVEASDAERRRLERDLHDGAQQRLLGIRLVLQLARGQAGKVGAVEQLLAEADSEVVGALEELRALARGIHPAILTEEGLAPALSALARRAPVPVEVTVCSERLPTPLEATAYFVAAEALANVAKHAHASRAVIEVARRDGRLTVEVADNGGGGADTEGTGLRGLRDRVEALDGQLEIESPPGVGTRVSAVIPCA